MAAASSTQPSLISLFDSICASDGDSTAFVSISAKNDSVVGGGVELSSLSERDHFTRTEVGFSELREASIAIASELCHRHGVTQSKISGISTLSIRGVLVISDHPSAGESAAVLACTRLRVPFVPVDLVGPNRVGMKRLRSLLSDCDCKTAIIVVDASDTEGVEDQAAESAVDTDETDDDFLTAPAMQTTADSQLDQHPAVKLLERAGIYRHVMISSRDGTLLNGLGISELDLPEPIVEETSASLRDPLYILCTSGSTSSGQGQQKSGKAVAQTHGGLLNRIQWQWETFPFVQQMRRDVGFVEANLLLDADGLPPKNDMVVRRTPLAFVDSICEIFASLLAGVPLYCPSSQLLRREGLVGILDEAEHVGATRITCLPSQLSQMLRIGNTSNTSKSKSWPWTSLNVAIVSGEPCPPSLPELWEKTMSASSSSSACPRKLLVNLYGQTESSADVLCAVISMGGAGKSSNISRFPHASKYLVLSDEGKWWSPAKKDTQMTADESLSRSLSWTVPCGLPILRHNVMVGLPQQRGENDVKFAVGNLFVQGPGLALGYLNRQNENEKSFREINGEQWFDTGDLACIGDGTSIVYILGRSGDDEGKEIGNERGASLIGKVNGVLVHTAEVEAIFSSALWETVKRKEETPSKVKTLLDDGLNVVAVIHQVKSADNDGTFATCSHSTRLSVFVDASSMPVSLLRHQAKDLGKSSTSTLISPKEAFAPAYQSLFDEVKSELIGIDGEFTCHSALVPHRIHLVSRMPRSGAAGKIDRSELVRLSSLPFEVHGQRTEHQVSANCPIHNMVSNTFRDILGLDSSSHAALSFSELGGDSMMAIECAFKINQKLSETKGGIAVEHVSAIDVMDLSVDKMKSFLLSGRKAANTRIAEKRDEKPTNAERLESLGDVVLTSSACSGNNAAGIYIKWKCRLLMCVDAKPILIDSSSHGNVAIVGSQGGDLLCCCSESGKVLQRKQLSGKVEGGMAVCQIDTSSNGNGQVARTFIFVCTYSDDGGPSGNGKIYALEFCKKRKLGDDQGQSISVTWEQNVRGKLKGSPACFSIAEAQEGSHQANDMRSGLLVGSYDGTLRYFDAVSGELVANLDDLGGAIHATPAIFCRNDGSKCALVASSTWAGRLTCIHLQHKVMTKLWYFDTWAPIYASPLICEKGREKQRVAVFGAVDGDVRCVDLEAGAVEKEVWRVSVGCRKPIFSGCTMNRKGTGEDGSSIVVGSHDGSVSCLSIDDGSCVWRYEGIGSIVGTPGVVDDMIVAGSTSGDIVCLDSKSGAVKKKLPEPIDGEIFSNVAINNSCVFFGARDSHLYKIDL